MTVAKLQDSILQSSAIEVTNGKQWQTNNPVSWNQGDSKTIYALWTINGYEADTITYLQNIGLNISVSGGHELEYYVQYEIGSNNYVETDWQSASTPVNVAYRWDESSTYGIYVYVYVRRVDGEDLYYYDPETSRLFANGIRISEQEIEIQQTTAIPPEWLNNTTQTYQTATTVTRPVAYDDLVGTVPALSPDVGGTPPAWFEQFNPMEQDWFVDIISGLADWFNVVNTISNQIPIFWVFGGFFIIGLLLAWLLH